MNVIDVLTLMEATGKTSNSFQWMVDNAEVDDRLDRATMMGMILKECGALVPMYKEMDAFMFNHKLWFKANKLVISHLCDTLDYEYNPIENYDWHEVGNKVNNSKRLSDIESKSNETTQGTSKSVIDKSYVDTEGSTTMSISDRDKTETDKYGSQWKDDNVNTRNLQNNSTFEDEDKTSAYNEDLYQPEKTNDGTNNTTDTGTITDDGSRKHSGTDTNNTDDTVINTGADSRVLVHDASSNAEEGETNKQVNGSNVNSTAELGRETGSHEKFVLGATGNYTKQMMIDQERGIAKFNIYEWIADKYSKDNCYRVY